MAFCTPRIALSSITRIPRKETTMESNKTAHTYLAATVAFALCFFATCEAPAIISLF